MNVFIVGDLNNNLIGPIALELILKTTSTQTSSSISAINLLEILITINVFLITQIVKSAALPNMYTQLRDCTT